MSKMKYILIILSLIFFIGCALLDLTKGHNGLPPICEIHKCEMHPESIKVYGERAYVEPYIKIAKENFPNHGGHLYNNEKEDTPYERDVIDFVCPKCQEEYEKYWVKN
jgi:hypothetical protein